MCLVLLVIIIILAIKVSPWLLLLGLILTCSK